VKELNPGIDLLLAADWDVIFEDRQEGQEEALEHVEGGKNVPIPASSMGIVTNATTTMPSLASAMTGTYIHGREWVIGGIVVAAATVVLSGTVVLRAKRK
jgi:hypothetical protein